MSKADRLAAALAAASTRAEARGALTDINPTRADMAKAGAALGVTAYGSKTQVATQLTDTVGAREDAAAIRGNGWDR